METFLKLLPYLIAAIVGSIIHIVSKFADLEKTKRSFHPKSWFKKNLYRTILGFCLSIGGVVVLSESQELTIAVCLMIGYTGDSIMKKGQKK